jgi:hypothetical protein
MTGMERPRHRRPRHRRPRHRRPRHRRPRFYKYRREQPSILFWSSLVLMTNMWAAYMTGQYLYSMFFGSLVISSLVYHTRQTLATNLWDKLWVGSIVVYGGWKTIIKWGSSDFTYMMGCVLAFFFVVWVYVYGFFTQSFCFDPLYGNRYHALMHIVVSVGHHLIIFL